MTKEDIVRRLTERRYQGYPGQQANSDEEWFTSLAEPDKKNVVDVLKELLSTRKQLGPALWFLSWVIPLPDLISELVDLAPYIDELISHDPSLVGRESYLGMYVHVVSQLEIEEVLPYLHRWASMAEGPTRVRTQLAELASLGLLHFSKEDGTRYAPGILRGDLMSGVAVMYSASGHFMSSHLRMYPDDVAALIEAYSGLDARSGEYAYQAFEMSAHEQVRIGARDHEWQQTVLRTFRRIAGLEQIEP